jgi:transposase-like protein
MNGTYDEVYPPKWMEEAREMMRPYMGKHRITRIEGLNHSIVNRQVRVIGPVWLRTIQEGFFDR